MSDIKSEFPDQKQRLAVCHEQLRGGRMPKSARKVPVQARLVSEIRDQIQHDLNEQFGDRFWIIDLDVEQHFCLAVDWQEEETSAVRIDYTEEADPEEPGEVEYMFGEPRPVENRWVFRDTMEVAATKVVRGAAAETLIAKMRQDNKLWASLEGTPNSHLVVFDLTTLDKVSQHAGATRYKLLSSGIKDALPSLIGKPVHVTSDLDGHFEANGSAKSIGVFLGAEVMEQTKDGSTLRVVAMIWDSDFPDELEQIQDEKEELGASYEIVYAAKDATRKGNVVEVAKYAFAGGALLKKSAAAHPETKVLVASPAPSPRLRPIKPPPMAPHTPHMPPPHAPHMDPTRPAGSRADRRSEMPKYAGIPAELEASVEAAIAAALAQAEASRSKSTLETEASTLKQQVEAHAAALRAKDTEIEALKAEKVVLTTKVSEQTVELAAAQTRFTEQAAELKVLHDAAEALELKAKSDEAWTKVKAQWGLDESQRAAKQPLIDKIVAGKEGLTVDEIFQLQAGGKGTKPAPAAAQVLRVVAGALDPNQTKADPETLRKNFPSLQGLPGARKTAGG